MEKQADLHVHTYLSDSTFTPAQVVDYAQKIGLACVAITDHDCVDGIEPAVRRAYENSNIEIIPAVELTAETDDTEVHILGFFIDYKNVSFEKKLQEIRDDRVSRIYKMVEKLKEFDIDIDASDVFKIAGPGSVGRLHVAQVLYNKGAVANISEAFSRYIGHNKPCYVKRFKLSPKEAIKMIYKVKGIPVLAHPYIMKKDEMISELIKAGLRGIEVYHSDHTNAAQQHYKKLAEENNLLITGGSDCHGMGKGEILMGKVKVPYELVEKLKEARFSLK